MGTKWVPICVRSARFHDLCHTFGTGMAAVGVALRTLQEWMGHRDFKTTLIYANYQPGAEEAALVEKAFPTRDGAHPLGVLLVQRPDRTPRELTFAPGFTRKEAPAEPVSSLLLLAAAGLPENPSAGDQRPDASALVRAEAASHEKG